MATFTITTSRTFDEAFFSTRAGNDIYNISAGARLTIDTDTRWCANSSLATGNLGALAIAAASGGEFYIDGTGVRIIPYNTGTGNVPAIGTSIVQGGVSGYLLGVWSAFNVAPTAAASPMPVSGWIKIKTKVGGNYAAGALTNIGAAATGPDIVGWIEVVGIETQSMTIPRLGKFTARGEWFEHPSLTDGVRTTTYQLPASLANTFYPGVYVETAPGSGTYEFYPSAGSLAAVGAVATDAVRGKVCWISSQGLLRLGHDGTNSVGYIPVAGCKIRTPNILTMSTTSGAQSTNSVPNGTLASRYDFATSGAGVVDADRVNFCWAVLFAQAYAVTLVDCAVADQISITENATAPILTRVGVGCINAITQFSLIMNQCLTGGEITDCVFARRDAVAAGNYVHSLTDVDGASFIRCRMFIMVHRGNASSGAVLCTRVRNTVWEDCVLGGAIGMVTCANLVMTDTGYFDFIGGTTLTTFPQYVWDIATGSSNILMDGLTFFGIPLVQPYSGLFRFAAGCSKLLMRNIGAPGAPLDLGGPMVSDAAWTRATTTATVTSIAHGLKVNDIIHVRLSDSVAAITVTAKTIASVPTADTFTFACLNAGAASGVLTYYPMVVSTVVLCAAVAASDDIRIQRVYVEHARSNAFSGDNTTSNLVLDNFQCDDIHIPLLASNLTFVRGLKGLPSLAAQVSAYGTHWIDYFISELSTNLAAQAWTRVTTTATVTSADHRLKTGDLIYVTVSSATAAIVLGQKAVTVVNSTTFTFPCLNAGAASGTLTYENLSGRIAIQMNEATAETASQVTINSGTPAFTSVGSIYMPLIGDRVTFEMPDYIKGHTGFPNSLAVMAGGTIANHNLFYAIDKNDGAGWSAQKNLHYNRAGGGGSSSSTTVTMTSTTGVSPGDYVAGTGIDPTAYVISVDSGTNITVSAPNTGAVSGVLTFRQYPSETGIDPDAGFKMRWIIETIATNALAISSVYIHTRSTTASRALQYPLDLATLELTGLRNPSEVRVFDAANPTVEIAGEETITGGVFSASIDIATYPAVNIAVLSLGYQNIRLTNIAIAGDVSIPIQQQLDRQYLNP
jgi:hypothetical protein